MKYNSQMIPEVLHSFNVYDGNGNRQIGVSDEMSMSEIKSKVATISGAGITGSYDVPIVGFFDSIVQEIPFRVLYLNLSELMNPMKVQTINIRGAIQVSDKSTGVSDFVDFRYMIKGRTTTLNPGTIKLGEVMGSKISIEATYVLIEIGGEVMVEIDKLNGIFKVDGIDMLEKVRKMC